MCPTLSSSCLPRGPSAWCPLPFLSCSVTQLFLCTPPFPYSFLSLAGNQIRQVENLRDLLHLQFLDLSKNLIEQLKLGRNALTLAPCRALLPLCPHLPVLALTAQPPGVLGAVQRQWLWAGRWV